MSPDDELGHLFSGIHQSGFDLERGLARFRSVCQALRGDLELVQKVDDQSRLVDAGREFYEQAELFEERGELDRAIDQFRRAARECFGDAAERLDSAIERRATQAQERAAEARSQQAIRGHSEPAGTARQTVAGSAQRETAMARQLVDETDGSSLTVRNTSAIGRQVRVPKTAELVAAHLRRQIVRGELTEGQALPPEATLMAQFGVSRPTLREAFRLLESEALITVRRGAHGGAQVHPPTSEVAARYTALILEYRNTPLGDIRDALAVLEAPCARQVASSRTQDDVELLRRALRDAEAALDDPGAFARSNLAFHGLLVDLAGNQTVSVMAAQLRYIIDLTNNAHAATEAPGNAPRRANRKGFRAHQQLVELIADRDATAADELWREHLASPDDYLVDVPRVRTVLDVLG